MEWLMALTPATVAAASAAVFFLAGREPRPRPPTPMEPTPASTGPSLSPGPISTSPTPGGSYFRVDGTGTGAGSTQSAPKVNLEWKPAASGGPRTIGSRPSPALPIRELQLPRPSPAGPFEPDSATSTPPVPPEAASASSGLPPVWSSFWGSTGTRSGPPESVESVESMEPPTMQLERAYLDPVPQLPTWSSSAWWGPGPGPRWPSSGTVYYSTGDIREPRRQFSL